ncbi:LPS export ABC transporter periplasmic protein LptC [Echinicola strongylocentroti]|uniref:LPS export ABC transporter periplasmic protein LptC n=1 Tax=Echinicola strongylocentroti TaxID=1795355 RepID=A0A2Z4IIH2_9BACT|nr:LPS export ABC transporter periplasmic protein LptC [Echinicola strongylocentroti]AWW30517.1 LPS export ABC transporter periplasmic protein LptC [Echinicola strongylocentroti]
MIRNLFVVFVMAWAGFSCRESVDLSQLEDYNGPMRITTDMEVFRSDSAVVRIKLNAGKQLVFNDQDMEFPDGIQIHFFDKEGKLTSTIRADKAYYDNKTKLYRGVGDVRVHNIEKGEKLNTEELFWNERKETIFTEKFFTIEKADGTLLKGTGLESDQSFSKYTFYSVKDTRLPLQGEEN